MGLDITAYSKLRRVGKHSDNWCEDYENHVQAFAYDCFPESFRGIPILDTKVNGDESKFLEGGCFAFTNSTETHDFRAGSSRGYGHWRADLQRQFNPDRDPALPFYELIWFADNEGSIGPDAARDLLADFERHADRYAPETGGCDSYYLDKYQDWTRACQLAADGGLIRFH